MAVKTGISWTDATWSPVVGCSRVSEGCRNCYSERLVATRLRHTEKYSGLAQMTQAGPRWTNVVRCVDEALLQPLRWTRPRRIFVNSMSDTFHKDVPDAFLDRMFAVMALCPQHTFQVLTKRPERAVEYFTGFALRLRENPDKVAAEIMLDTIPHGQTVTVEEFRRLHRPLPNVWFGTSVEDQAAADARIPHLLKVPAKVRFLSCEPLLGPVDLERWFCPVCPECDGYGYHGDSDPQNEEDCRKCEASGYLSEYIGEREDLHWVIAGGESGPNARPMHPDWARSLRDQCAAAGVPFHFKQVGAWDAYEHYDQHEWESAYSRKLIDGNAFPDFDDPRAKGWDRDIEEGLVFRNLGAGATGRLLDGVLHDAFPEVALAR